MSFSPRFLADGQRVIMSLQQGGNSNLFVMDLRRSRTTRLTDTPAIDTSPSYATGRGTGVFRIRRGGKPADLCDCRRRADRRRAFPFGEGVLHPGLGRRVATTLPSPKTGRRQFPSAS